MYDEVGTPRATRPKPTINPLLPAAVATEIISPATPEPQMEPKSPNDNNSEDVIRNKLQAKFVELGFKGQLEYPPIEGDFSQFVFDAAHTQGDKHPHDVTEEEARKFIAEAYFTIVKYNGNSYNYYGKEGATYVRLDTQTLRTSFKREEYDDDIKKLIEVFENEIRNL